MNNINNIINQCFTSASTRFGKVLSLLLVCMAICSGVWADTTFGIKGNTHGGFPDQMTEMTANGTTFTYSFTATNTSGACWFKLYKNKTEDDSNMVYSIEDKFTIGTTYDCSITGSYKELKVDLIGGKLYLVIVRYTSDSDIQVTVSEAPLSITNVRTLTNQVWVTFNKSIGQLSDWSISDYQANTHPFTQLVSIQGGNTLYFQTGTVSVEKDNVYRLEYDSYCFLVTLKGYTYTEEITNCTTCSSSCVSTPTVKINSVTSGDQQLIVNWGVSNITPTSQTVQYKSESGDWQNGPSVTASATTATITGLTNDTEYTVRVIASDGTDSPYAESKGTPSSQTIIPILVESNRSKTRQDGSMFLVYIDGYPGSTYPQDKSKYSFETVSGTPEIHELQDAAGAYLYFTLSDASSSGERVYKINCSTNSSCAKLTFADGETLPTITACGDAPVTSTAATVRAGSAPAIGDDGATVSAYLALPGCYGTSAATVSKITAYYKLGSTPSTTDNHVDLTTGTFSQGSLHNLLIPAASLETGTYHVKFTATNESGESDLSDEICFNWVGCDLPAAGFAITAGSTTPEITTTSGTTTTTLTTSAEGEMTYKEWYCSNSPSVAPTFSATDVLTPTVTFHKEGTYKFKLKAGCSSSVYAESEEITITVSGKLYIKGPVHDNGCWPGYNTTAWTSDNGVYTNTFTAYKNCQYGNSEYVLSRATNDNKGIFLNHKEDDVDMGFDPDASNCNWEFSTRDGNANNYRVKESFYNAGDEITIIVTHIQDKQWKMSVTNGCVAPSITAQPSAEAVAYCQGAEATALSVTAAGTEPLLYQWYSNTTASATGGKVVAGATSSSYTPSTGETGTTYYYCIITGCQSRTATSEVSGAISVEEAPVLTNIYGPDEICSVTDNIRYETDNLSNVTYHWTSPSILGPTPQNTTVNYAVFAVGANVGTTSVVVTAESNTTHCNSNSLVFDGINVKGAVDVIPGTIEGSSLVCEGSEVTFASNSTNARTFSWTAPDDWVVKSGAGTRSITYTVGKKSGNVKVQLANCPSTPSVYALKYVSVTAAPVAPTAIAGAAEVCKRTEYTYTIEDTGADEYVWVIPAGWEGSCVLGDKTTLKATPGPDAISGQIKVKAKTSCGQSGYTTKDVTVSGHNIAINVAETPKSANATYPWQPISLVAVTDDEVESVVWNYTYSTTLADNLTVFKTNNKNATLKSGAPVSDYEYYSITATTVETCPVTSEEYKVYINSDDTEVCNH